jgi:hypothetical protein
MFSIFIFDFVYIWAARQNMVGLRFETRRLCSGPPPLCARSATLVAASRLFIVYAGSSTILRGATGGS